MRGIEQGKFGPVEVKRFGGRPHQMGHRVDRSRRQFPSRPTTYTRQRIREGSLMALLGRILVIGATGHVGQQVVAQAADLVEALFDGAGDFMPQPVTGVVEEITGRAPRSVRRWAFDHAEARR